MLVTFKRSSLSPHIYEMTVFVVTVFGVSRGKFHAD